MTLRLRQFPDIRRSGDINGRRRHRPGLQLQFSVVSAKYGPIYSAEIRR
jgi:hypothetical protein